VYLLINSERILSYILSVIKYFVFLEYGDNLQRIIADMEDALMRIPSESNAQEVYHTSDIPTRDEAATSRPNQTGFVPLKPAETCPSKPVVAPLKFTGQGSLREFEHFLPALNEQQKSHTNMQPSKFVEPVKLITPKTQIAQRELELMYAKQLELAYDQLRKERDNVLT
jgi:hypothetical protein